MEVRRAIPTILDLKGHGQHKTQIKIQENICPTSTPLFVKETVLKKEEETKGGQERRPKGRSLL